MEFPGAQTAIITVAIIGWIILLIVLIVLFFFYCRNKRGRYKVWVVDYCNQCLQVCKGTYLIHFLDTIFLTFHLSMSYLYPSPQQEIELHANNACGQEYVIIIYRMSIMLSFLCNDFEARWYIGPNDTACVTNVYISQHIIRVRTSVSKWCRVTTLL